MIGVPKIVLMVNVLLLGNIAYAETPVPVKPILPGAGLVPVAEMLEPKEVITK